MQRAAAQIIPKWPRDCRWGHARPRECAVHRVPVSGCCWGIYVEDGSDDKGAHCVEVDDPAGRVEDGAMARRETEGRRTIRNDRLMRGSRIQDRETARARDGAQASRTGSPETHGSSDEATSGNLRTPRSFIVEPAT